MELIPNALVPDGLDFMVNLFESEVVIRNEGWGTIYVTPLTMTYGKPQVIHQPNRIRQRNFVVEEGQSLTLQYDMADSPLDGLLVCENKWNCYSTTDVQNENIHLRFL